MPSLEEIIQIGVAQMSNPLYIGFIAMILMQYVGKEGICSLYNVLTKKDEKEWTRKNLAYNAITLLLTLCIATGFRKADAPIGEALLRGALGLPIAVGEYEVVKNIIGALGHKWR